ncbi:MAG: endonuclease NucS domain-containing protein [Candidatus Hodarchaeales archaeon]|jgi:RecB family endonuclease NucS
MGRKIYSLPLDTHVLKDKLNEHVSKNVIIIFGHCSAYFDGIIKSSLEQGDRILIVKKDLSIMLHGPTGVKPIQWQKAHVGKVSFKITDDHHLQMETYRPKTDESFFITFSEIYNALAFDAKDISSASITGDEKDFVDYLASNTDIIEKELKIIERERETDHGFIDIFARDGDSKLVIIEVKKQQATLADAHQLKRYFDYFKKQGQDVRGIIVATGFPTRVIKYLKSFGLEYCSVPWQDVFPTRIRPTSIQKSKKIDSFFPKNKEN